MKLLFTIAKTSVGGAFIRRSFSLTSKLLFRYKIHETKTIFALWHPVPAYPVHILIIPKPLIPSISEITSNYSLQLMEVFKTADMIITRKLQNRTAGYQLVTNSGKYQDVPILHFHLIPTSVVIAEKQAGEG